MSATPDSTFTSPEQRIADLERQLAERDAEIAEAGEQQAAIAEVLQVINSSPSDLAPVFDVILQRAHAVCGSSHGALFLRDGERFLPAAMSDPELIAAPLRQGGMGSDAPLVRPLLAGEPFAHIIDLTLVDHPLARAAVATGVRTLLSVPLRKGATLIGMINAARFEVHPFSDKQIALLQNFAAQAVIAMENARLLTETREALEQQTATAAILQVINSSPGDLAPVFDAMLDKALHLCEASFGHLWVYEGGRFRATALRGAPPEYADFLAHTPVSPPAGTALAKIADGSGPVQFADVTAEEAYRETPLVRFGAGRTIVGVPLRKDNDLLGALTIYREEVRPFTDKQIALLENFAAQAVIAMENARLLGELRQRTDQVAELNRGLEARVAEQVDELGRVGRLKRFLAPQLAELIVSQGDEKILESHRREIVVVFCDLRGYTAFTETAEPEEVLDFLREYHGALGPLVSQFEGTLDQFSGDGIMVFFNDPVPCPDPAERAVKMATAMREAAGKLIAAWRRHGSELGFGAGIAQGYATLGQIGFSDRSGYTAIGTVCNLAARLCAEAKDGQILVSSRIAEAVEAVARLEDLGNLELRGLRRPVAAFNVVQSTSAADARPNLTVVARGPGPD
jgi:class 3 adenylate cyclase